MIGFMKGDYETGLYSVSAKGRAVLTVTGGVVWNAVLPTATNLWKDGKKAQFESLPRKVIAGVCGVQLLVTLACFLFAKQIILIIGGNAYLGAVPSSAPF
jgi:O-antigen/teichoic acid export membrane protein